MHLHADDSPDSFPLRQQGTEDIGRLPKGYLYSWFVQPAEDQGTPGTTFQGFMDVNAVKLPLDAEYYLCGPLPFLQAVRSALIAKGIRAKDIQYEVFGPDLLLADFQ